MAMKDIKGPNAYGIAQIIHQQLIGGVALPKFTEERVMNVGLCILTG